MNVLGLIQAIEGYDDDVEVDIDISALTDLIGVGPDIMDIARISYDKDIGRLVIIAKGQWDL